MKRKLGGETKRARGRARSVVNSGGNERASFWVRWLERLLEYASGKGGGDGDGGGGGVFSGTLLPPDYSTRLQPREGLYGWKLNGLYKSFTVVNSLSILVNSKVSRISSLSPPSPLSFFIPSPYFFKEIHTPPQPLRRPWNIKKNLVKKFARILKSPRNKSWIGWIRVNYLWLIKKGEMKRRKKRKIHARFDFWIFFPFHRFSFSFLLRVNAKFRSHLRLLHSVYFSILSKYKRIRLIGY